MAEHPEHTQHLDPKPQQAHKHTADDGHQTTSALCAQDLTTEPPQQVATLAAALETDLELLKRGERDVLTPPSSERKQRGELTRTQFAERFQIVRPLGQGGMGALYIVADPLDWADLSLE